MSKHKGEIISISDLKQAEQAIIENKCDPGSIPIMAPKMIHRIIKLENIILQDAIIIKQDMLSIGGEVAVPKHTFDLQGESAAILVIGTLQQLRLLVEKLKRHYSRIQQIAIELEEIIQTIA